jgi:hypothetical protein
MLAGNATRAIKDEQWISHDQILVRIPKFPREQLFFPMRCEGAISHKAFGFADEGAVVLPVKG